MAGVGRGRGRLVGVVGALIVPLVSTVLALTGCGSTTRGSTSAGCAERVLRDWSDNGRVDGLYASSCYVEAIADLPEDVRTYSSATDDISRALESRQRIGPAAAGTKSGAARARDQAKMSRRLSSEEVDQLTAQTPSTLRGPPPALVAVTGIAGLVAISGLVAYLVRRSRGAR
jgi:hypothetical protein